MEDPLTIYGQRPQPIETPEFLSTKFTELSTELDQLSTEQKVGWTRAQQTCPELVDTSHQLMFLRCEVYNVKQAALRICNYWDKRIELFGDVMAFRPLSIADLIPPQTGGGTSEYCNTANDEVEKIKEYTRKGLNLGFLRPTGTNDTGGRAIIFIDPLALKHYDHSTEERYGIVRLSWYILHTLLEQNDTVQKLGVVGVTNRHHHAKLSYVDRKLMKMNGESISGCIPVRMGAFHICQPPWFFSNVVFPIIKFVLPERMRKRLRVHSGSSEKVLERLGVVGLGREVLPSDIGGDVILDMDAWMKECQKKAH